MPDDFFSHPILNSPYEVPARHWELDAEGYPTHRKIEERRRASFITPIPKPKKKKSKSKAQTEIVFDEGQGLSTAEQQYEVPSIINQVRSQVAIWRDLPERSWNVTPETAKLLRHWRAHAYQGPRPFFCRIEAVETLIWLTEVASPSRGAKLVFDHLERANADANPELSRIALKLATGAGKTTVAIRSARESPSPATRPRSASSG